MAEYLPDGWSMAKENYEMNYDNWSQGGSEDFIAVTVEVNDTDFGNYVSRHAWAERLDQRVLQVHLGHRMAGLTSGHSGDETRDALAAVLEDQAGRKQPTARSSFTDRPNH